MNRLTVVVFLVVFSHSTFPASSDVIGYLINKPISSLEWALYKLNVAINEREPKDTDSVSVWGAAEYDSETNQIIISRFVSYVIDPINPKEQCGYVISGLRALLGCNPTSTGSFMVKSEHGIDGRKVFNYYFGQSTYAENIPGNFEDSLAANIHLVAELTMMESGTKYRCEAPLLGADVLHLEQQ